MKQERYLRPVSPLGTWQLTESLGANFYFHALTLRTVDNTAERIPFSAINLVLCLEDNPIAVGACFSSEFKFARLMAISRLLGVFHDNTQSQ